MLRTFKTYTFVLPNRVEYRQLIKELTETYDYEKLVFEIGNLDHLRYTIGKGSLSTEEMLASSKTMRRHKGLVRYAYAKHVSGHRAAGQHDGRRIYVDFAETELTVSNLDNNWEEPNPCATTESIAPAELEGLLGSLSRNRFSTLLVCLDGIPWFGLPKPATYGYNKAQGGYKRSIGYLSSSLAVSVLSYESRLWFMPALR
jgi:hypothetical protein